MTVPACQLNKEATQELISWVNTTQAHSSSNFEAAQQIVRRLGVHYRQGRAEVGFWTPELSEQQIPAEHVFLELLTPLGPIDFQIDRQQVRFQRQYIPLRQSDDYFWGAIEGMNPGSREQVGPFFWLKYRNREGAPRTLTPVSLPIPSLPQNGWRPVLTTPGLKAQQVDQPNTLANSHGVVFVKQ